jgi:hypothetical protein
MGHLYVSYLFSCSSCAIPYLLKCIFFQVNTDATASVDVVTPTTMPESSTPHSVPANISGSASASNHISVKRNLICDFDTDDALGRSNEAGN